jgi:tetratricopeptide (TPR) repeat protein
MKHIGFFLRDIHFNQRTGQLSYQRGDVQKALIFQDGGLIFARTNVPEERLGEILHKVGKISTEIMTSIPHLVQPDKMLGEVLVQKKIISQKDLYDGLMAQMNAITLSLFAHFDAELVFRPRERFLDYDFEFKMSVPLLIERGIREMEFHPLLKSFFEDKVAVLKGKSNIHMLTEDEKDFLTQINGKTAAEAYIVSQVDSPDELWKTLYLFYCLDLIDVRLAERPKRKEPRKEETPKVEPKVEVKAEAKVGTKVESPPKPDEGRDEKRKEAAAEAQEAVPADMRAKIDEALELKNRIPELDYYQVLGVTRQATEADIKKAYFQLARKFHPDLFGRGVTQEIKAQIEELFDYITKSYRVLTSKEQKPAFVPKSTAVMRDDDRDKSKNAEIRFRQGKTLMSQGRFEEAAMYLEQAVRFNDTKGDYYLLLAMAESKVDALSKKAEHNFQRAIELEPWNAEGHVGLGRLYKKEGLVKRAKKEFERALEIEAGHKVARSELRDLAEGDEESKGFKGLFSKDLFGKKKK